MKKIFIISVFALFAGVSCTKFLDKEPKSEMTPETFFTQAENLNSYTLTMYSQLPYHSSTGYGTFESDRHTDDCAYMTPDDMWAPGYWKVGESGGGYEFTKIYKCNYFLDIVRPYLKEGKITGSTKDINQALGEAYFLRAWNYFGKLKSYGDYPIVTKCLNDNMEELVAASKRAPRNEVARFILSDLDSAIVYLNTSPNGGKNRLSPDCAHLLKSRVALYEGTWLKYFDGTAFVPGGPGWPGGTGYIYPSGSLENEVIWFLKVCMSEAKIVADKYNLTTNTGKYQNTSDMEANPYYDMFADSNMEKYDEVLLWKAFDANLNINNRIDCEASTANSGHGITKSLVDAYLMENGLPIYASSSGYKGDKNFKNVVDGRDSRLVIFMKTPGSNNFHNEAAIHGVKVEPYPNITSGTNTEKYVTGYCIRKGKGFDGSKATYEDGNTGSIVFRATEAYLNYIEAAVECTNSLDINAKTYWRAIRARSKVSQDYDKTISATNMAKEAETDLAAYSAGQLVKPLIYNIRRERRCEFIAEGFRNDDLHRWRSMDQLISKPYHVLGLNLWENTEIDQIKAASGGSWTEGKDVSEESFSKYLAPYHINQNNHAYNGYGWRMAHYLNPIAIQHFLITADGQGAENSTLYQNPGWPLTAGEGAEY